jgi:DNA-binding transcriptional MerR regulator
MRSDDRNEPPVGSPEPGADVDDDGLPVGGKARPARRYLAIGELLDTLRPEFPDLTLSKIRFLEQQGLLEPERTPSGYRKFFSGQVERLWWILDQQRDGYVPLKEIRQRLASAEASGILSPLSAPAPVPTDPGAKVTRLEPRTSALIAPIPLNRAGEASNARSVEELEDHDHDEQHDPSLRHAPKEALGESRHPSSVARRVQQAFAVISASVEHPTGGGHEVGQPARSENEGAATRRIETGHAAGAGSAGRGPDRPSTVAAPARNSAGTARQSPRQMDTSGASEHLAAVSDPGSVTPPAAAASVSRPLGSANPLISQYTGASFTFDELVRASGLEPEELRQLESFGLLAGHAVLGATYYDEDALIAARAAKQFKAFGIEPRHMRIYRTMADRESGFLEQIVSPLVHRRQDAARAVAADQLEDLIALGTQMRLVALRRLLRASLDGR